MKEHFKKLSLENEIIVLKEKLHKLLCTEPMHSEEVLGASKKLDSLISKYYFYVLKKAS